MPHPLDTCQVCQVPKKQEGFASFKEYVLSHRFKGRGVGTSTVSKAEADRAAIHKAYEEALILQQSSMLSSL